MAKLIRKAVRARTAGLYGKSGKGGPGFEGSTQYTGITPPGKSGSDGTRRRRNLGPINTVLGVRKPQRAF